MSRVSDVLKYFVDYSYDESDDGLKKTLVGISNEEADVCKNYKEILAQWTLIWLSLRHTHTET